MPCLLLRGSLSPKKMSIMKSMKHPGIGFLLLMAALLTSCQGSRRTPEPETTPPPVDSFEFFRDGYYQALLPSWEESPELDRETLRMVYRDGQFIAITRYQNLPEIFARQFLSFIEEDPNAYLVQQSVLEDKPFFEFTTREDNQTKRIQAVLDYCQGYTYVLITGGRDTVENASLFEEVLASSSCQDPYRVPDLVTGKIGLMVNPALDDPWEGFYPALRLAKENGVQVLHTYLDWGGVEPAAGERVWDWQDALMGYRLQEGFEISLVVDVIHTTVRGSLPVDLEGKPFDDPEFIERFSDFISEVLDRYPVQYLSIGNEVNDYFVAHRDEIPAYETFFLAVRDRVHAEHPDVQVAMTFAYHDAESTDAVDIIKRLDLGDFLPLTLYIYSPGFVFDRAPEELEGYLGRILTLADDKPIAIVETGWNTAESLSGSQADQEVYLREVFRLLAENREQVEFISWFCLHDSQLENSRKAAQTFLPPDSPLLHDEAYLRDFVDFLNYFGLRENDGTPKQAWFAFQEEASAYLEIFGESE